MDSAFITLAIAQIEPPSHRAARRNAQSEAARSLALKLLKQHHAYASDILSFEKTAAGKPVLAMPYAFDFSLTHSGPWVGCAMPAGPLLSPLGLGMDIEQFRHHDWQGYAELDVFHVLELDWIMSSQHEERDRRALICWCRKEAMLKATGFGLNLPLNQIGFDEQGTLVALPEVMGHISHWVIHCGEIQHEQISSKESKSGEIPGQQTQTDKLSLAPVSLAQQRAVYAVAWQSN